MPLREGISKTVSIIIVIVVIIAAIGGIAAYMSQQGPTATPTTTASPTTTAPTTTAPATTPSPTTTTEAKPIIIGATLSLTGKYGRTGEWYKLGYELWVEQVNKKGGLLGRPVKLILYDDQSDPTTAASLYEKLITVDKADLLLGPYSSAIAFAVSSVTEKYHKVMVEGGGNALKIFSRGYKYIFLTLPGLDENITKGLFDFIASLPLEKRPKTIAIINANDLFPKAIANGAVLYAKKLGLEIVLHEEYPKEAKDLTPLLTKIKDLNPDVLVGGTYFPDAVLIVKTLKQLNWRPKIVFLTVGPAMPEFWETLGEDANGIMGESWWEPTAPWKGVDEFVKAFREKYGKDPDYHAACAYAACQVIEEAVKAVGSLDQDKIAEWIRTYTIETIVGPLKYTEAGYPTLGPLLIQWQDGARVILMPKEATTGEPVYPLSPTWG
ncbi:MAG: amino acid ABC transporter substrate-binding protein [Desulfurococcales archaeon]|nr:amino acid ABC transporter substrate-binding protein [Desulfurococcales archaeon]